MRCGAVVRSNWPFPLVSVIAVGLKLHHDRKNFQRIGKGLQQRSAFQGKQLTLCAKRMSYFLSDALRGSEPLKCSNEYESSREAELRHL